MSMTKQLFVSSLLTPKNPVTERAEAFAPVNIAIAKYWGKRNEELLLPVTDSLSVAIGAGTTTTLSLAHTPFDTVTLNGEDVAHDSAFYQRLVAFLDLFRPTTDFFFAVETKNSIPTAAGLASSASGFAALVLALEKFFGWNLPAKKLSLLARLGSGSACRSLFPGFVLWNKGELDDGSDSFAEGLNLWWDELCFGVEIISKKQKKIDSRSGMKNTVNTSLLYRYWPEQVETTIETLMQAISEKNFALFGQAVETNALFMHSTMLTSNPPICYWHEESLAYMKTIWQARQRGVQVYFTMDAGPNIKLFFLKKDADAVKSLLSNMTVLPLLGPENL